LVIRQRSDRDGKGDGQDRAAVVGEKEVERRTSAAGTWEAVPRQAGRTMGRTASPDTALGVEARPQTQGQV
jgi:hypothetical protein